MQKHKTGRLKVGKLLYVSGKKTADMHLQQACQWSLLCMGGKNQSAGYLFCPVKKAWLVKYAADAPGCGVA